MNCSKVTLVNWLAVGRPAYANRWTCAQRQLKHFRGAKYHRIAAGMAALRLFAVQDHQRHRPKRQRHRHPVASVAEVNPNSFVHENEELIDFYNCCHCVVVQNVRNMTRLPM